MARAVALLAAAAALRSADAAFSCSAAGRTGAECAALDALYASAAGAGWRLRRGWAIAASGAVPGPDYCTFDGVDCDADGHVTAMCVRRGGGAHTHVQLTLPARTFPAAPRARLRSALPRNGLSGTVPPELVDLTRLKTLCVPARRGERRHRVQDAHTRSPHARGAEPRAAQGLVVQCAVRHAAGGAGAADAAAAPGAEQQPAARRPA